MCEDRVASLDPVGGCGIAASGFELEGAPPSSSPSPKTLGELLGGLGAALDGCIPASAEIAEIAEASTSS